MTYPHGDSDGNKFGRRERDRSRALKAQRKGCLHWRRFYEPGRQTLSVDTLAPDSLQALTDIAEAHTAGEGKTFYGWGLLAREKAEQSGRHVVESPTPENPYHADIHLPDTVMTDDKDRRRRAHQLADVSEWYEVRDPRVAPAA